MFALLVTKCVNKLLNRPRREDREKTKKTIIFTFIDIRYALLLLLIINKHAKTNVNKLVIVGGLGGLSTTRVSCDESEWAGSLPLKVFST